MPFPWSACPLPQAGGSATWARPSALGLLLPWALRTQLPSVKCMDARGARGSPTRGEVPLSSRATAGSTHPAGWRTGPRARSSATRRGPSLGHTTDTRSRPRKGWAGPPTYTHTQVRAKHRPNSGSKQIRLWLLRLLECLALENGGKPLGPQAMCAFHLAESPFLCFLVSAAGGYSTYPLLKEKKNKAATENEWNGPQWLDTHQPWAPANEGSGLGLCLLLGCAGERASPPEPGPG